MPLGLTRKRGEKIRIGKKIVITVKEIRRSSCRIFIDAPRDIEIIREELIISDDDSEKATKTP